MQRELDGVPEQREEVTDRPGPSDEGTLLASRDRSGSQRAPLPRSAAHDDSSRGLGSRGIDFVGTALAMWASKTRAGATEG